MIHLHLPGLNTGLNIIVWYQFFLHVIEGVAGEVVGTPIDVGLGTVLEERPWKNCSAFPEGQLWLNPVTARSLKPVRLSQGGATGELGGHSCITFLLNFVLIYWFAWSSLRGKWCFPFCCFKQLLKISVSDRTWDKPVAGFFTTWCRNWTTHVEDTASPNTSQSPTNAGRTDKKLL